MKVTLKEIAELLAMKNTAAKSGLDSFAIGQDAVVLVGIGALVF